MRRLLGLLYLSVAFGATYDAPPELTLKLAQSDPEYALRHLSALSGEIERERILKAAFTAALAQHLPAAQEFLPQVIDRAWIAELALHDTCVLAADVETTQPDAAQKLVLLSGLRNPALALREREWYRPFSF